MPGILTEKINAEVGKKSIYYDKHLRFQIA